jgi:ABC-type Zn uptake system ZnuABC Zn-binding protein ZnuA
MTRADHVETTPDRSRRERWLWPGVGAAVLLAGLLWLAGCSKAPPAWGEDSGSPRVVVTIAPLYSFVRGVAGDRVALKCLCTSTGPHHYETDSRDARMLAEADLLFSIGLKLDDTFCDTLCRVGNRSTLSHVKLGEELLRRKMVHKMRAHEHLPGAKGAAHVHGEFDPHVWLGIDQVVAMVEGIRDELSKVDPDHKDEYAKNTAGYVKKLQKLHADGRKELKGERKLRIVSFHDALEYFAGSFGLEITDVIETGPGVNPAPGHLARLVKVCRNVDAITVEPQYPGTNPAQTVQAALKKEGLDVPLVSVDPLETAKPEELTEEGVQWYEARMRRNLKALADVRK